mmetsp:Transcript_24063/g.49664  ORF Transcript_24063/g.49664 Transcript_24063/m.49664 type:complete len:112 (-) Transcript_24063:1544-1879(-)
MRPRRFIRIYRDNETFYNGLGTNQSGISKIDQRFVNHSARQKKAEVVPSEIEYRNEHKSRLRMIISKLKENVQSTILPKLTLHVPSDLAGYPSATLSQSVALRSNPEERPL